MSQLLASGDYPAVRAVLDVSLGDAELPADVIDQPIYAAAAIAEVIDHYPTAESETDTAILARLRRATVYLTAARLAPAVVRITSLTVTRGDVAFSRQTFDPEKRAAELRALADLELQEIIEPDDTSPSRPTMFTYARGGRALR